MRNCHNPVGVTLHKDRMVIAIRFAEFYVLLAAVLHWTSILVVGLRGRLEPSPPYMRADAEGVSILRPVCGMENHIEETLRSSFRLTYPHYEIVFCVASDSDPVIPLVRRLIAEHPRVAARLLVGNDRISINPKLNNVVKGWNAAAHDWIAMADSNLMMPPDYIERLLARWEPDTGLVSAPPIGTAPEGIAAELECGFLNTYQARWQLAADAFGFGFAHGKTLVFRRDILEKAGGVEALASEAAEDAAATKAIRKLGLKVRLVPRPFPQPLGQRRFVEVWRRQLRWARLRRASFRLFFYPEILSGAFAPFALGGLLVASGSIAPAAALVAATAWYGAEALLARVLHWPLSWRSPFLWIFRDAMLPVLWLTAMCGRDVAWRGHAMHVRGHRAAGELQLAEE